MFCDHACSNKARTQDVKLICEWCETEFTPSYNIKWRKFCTIRCAGFHTDNKLYIKYIKRWKKNLENGGNCGVISQYIRRYLFEKYENKCCECGWSEIHSITKNIPLEVDHRDGNWKNNKEKNLRLVCPNCHSLSPNYRALNKGKGRKYKK